MSRVKAMQEPIKHIGCWKGGEHFDYIRWLTGMHISWRKLGQVSRMRLCHQIFEWKGMAGDLLCNWILV